MKKNIREKKKEINLPKPIGKELDEFLRIVCEGIREEYEKGWSERKLKEDQKELKKYMSECMNWAYGRGETDELEKARKIVKTI